MKSENSDDMTPEIGTKPDLERPIDRPLRERRPPQYPHTDWDLPDAAEERIRRHLRRVRRDEEADSLPDGPEESEDRTSGDA